MVFTEIFNACTSTGIFGCERREDSLAKSAMFEGCGYSEPVTGNVRLPKLNLDGPDKEIHWNISAFNKMGQ